jgi:hypothetical protein
MQDPTEKFDDKNYAIRTRTKLFNRTWNPPKRVFSPLHLTPVKQLKNDNTSDDSADTSEGEKPAVKKQKVMPSVRKRLPLDFNL